MLDNDVHYYVMDFRRRLGETRAERRRTAKETMLLAGTSNRSMN